MIDIAALIWTVALTSTNPVPDSFAELRKAQAAYELAHGQLDRVKRDILNPAYEKALKRYLRCPNDKWRTHFQAGYRKITEGHLGVLELENFVEVVLDEVVDREETLERRRQELGWRGEATWVAEALAHYAYASKRVHAAKKMRNEALESLTEAYDKSASSCEKNESSRTLETTLNGIGAAVGRFHSWYKTKYPETPVNSPDSGRLVEVENETR